MVLGQNIASERALELAIEAGAEDIKETEDEEGQPLLQVRQEVECGPSMEALITMKGWILQCISQARLNKHCSTGLISRERPHQVMLT